MCTNLAHKHNQYISKMSEKKIKDDLRKILLLKKVVCSFDEKLDTLSSAIEKLFNSGKTLKTVWNYFLGWIEEKCFSSVEEFETYFFKRKSILAE